MNTILSSSLNEGQKVFSKKGTKLFLVMAVIIPLLTKFIVNNLFLTDWMELPGENITFTLLDVFVTILLPLFIFITSTDLFTGENERGTLLPIRPISRMELFLSKVIAISFFSLVQLLLVWISTILSSALFDQTFNAGTIFSSLGAFVISWIPLMVITAFSVFLALLFHSSVLAISGMIVIYLLMVVVPYFLPNLLYLFPSSYLDWYMQWLGNVSIRWIIQTLTYLCSAFALFFTIGYYMFSRKEA